MRHSTAKIFEFSFRPAQQFRFRKQRTESEATHFRKCLPDLYLHATDFARSQNIREIGENLLKCLLNRTVTTTEFRVKFFETKNLIGTIGLEEIVSSCKKGLFSCNTFVEDQQVSQVDSSSTLLDSEYFLKIE